jgi:hypothetical protein
MRKPEQELAEIKSIMERSTRFLSLSGLAGILAGIYSLLAAGLAYLWIYYPGAPYGYEISAIQEEKTRNNLVSTALLVFCLAVGTAWFLSRRKSEQNSHKFWTPAGKRFVLALFIPVVTGAAFCLALILQSQFAFVAPATLIFYGLGLLNASHFTMSDIRYLGFGQLILGLFAGFFPNYGLLLWAFGFGFLHIIYGTLMYLKYDR